MRADGRARARADGAVAAAALREGDREGRRRGRKKRMVGPTVWSGEWRASSNGGLDVEFGGICKMEVHLEVLLELHFFHQTSKF
jgi:hypothetical protein